jgi:hypothetical protein
MAFQDAAAKRINAGLLSGEAAASILDDLNALYRGSF